MSISNRKLRVFLCHALQDKPVVRELYQHLNAEGWIDPWLDEEKLLPGQDWDFEIEKAVEAADAVIVILSNQSVSKEGYVQKEIRRALDKAEEKPEDIIFIIPLQLEDCRIPRRLSVYQYQDYYKNLDIGYKRLCSSLEARANTVGVDVLGIKENLRRQEQDRARRDREKQIRIEAEEKVRLEEEEYLRKQAEEKARERRSKRKEQRLARKKAEEKSRQEAEEALKKLIITRVDDESLRNLLLQPKGLSEQVDVFQILKRQQQGKPIDLIPAINNAIKNILLPDNTTVFNNIQKKQDIPAVKGDNGDRLSQFFTRLLSYLVQAMPYGGYLSIEVNRYEKEWIDVVIEEVGIQETSMDSVFLNIRKSREIAPKPQGLLLWKNYIKLIGGELFFQGKRNTSDKSNIVVRLKIWE